MLYKTARKHGFSSTHPPIRGQGSDVNRHERFGRRTFLKRPLEDGLCRRVAFRSYAHPSSRPLFKNRYSKTPYNVQLILL